MTTTAGCLESLKSADDTKTSLQRCWEDGDGSAVTSNYDVSPLHWSVTCSKCLGSKYSYIHAARRHVRLSSNTNRHWEIRVHEGRPTAVDLWLPELDKVGITSCLCLRLEVEAEIQSMLWILHVRLVSKLFHEFAWALFPAYPLTDGPHYWLACPWPCLECFYSTMLTSVRAQCLQRGCLISFRKSSDKSCVMCMKEACCTNREQKREIGVCKTMTHYSVHFLS